MVIANLYMEVFEERVMATAIYQPNIWKQYVDGTFKTLDQDYVDGFLQDLSNQEPTVNFTMAIVKYSTFSFLNTSVTKDFLLATTKKPTHTNT